MVLSIIKTRVSLRYVTVLYFNDVRYQSFCRFTNSCGRHAALVKRKLKKKEAAVDDIQCHDAHTKFHDSQSISV
jgi:hypothetical protein